MRVDSTACGATSQLSIPHQYHSTAMECSSTAATWRALPQRRHIIKRVSSRRNKSSLLPKGSGPEATAVGQGVYFAQTAQAAHAKTRHCGVILAAEVRLGKKFYVALNDLRNRYCNRVQTCEDALIFSIANGCE